MSPVETIVTALATLSRITQVPVEELIEALTGLAWAGEEAGQLRQFITDDR